MKKFRFRKSGSLVISALIIFAGLLCISCKEKNEIPQRTGEATFKIKSNGKSAQAINVSVNEGKATFNSMSSYFSLDSFAEEPEDMLGQNTETKAKDKKSKKDKDSTSVIPKIRKLDEYKIKYSSERKKFNTYTAAKKETEDEDLSGLELRVEDWGPKTSVVSEAKYPQFYVIFSQPVRSLAALDAPSNKSDIVTITPSLKGSFHWYGTQHISFEAEEAADPSVVYTIKVDPQLKSIYGNTIRGETVFKTAAEPVKIKNIWGGYIKENMCAYDNTTGALPEYENRVFVRTNYLLKAESLASKLVIKSKNILYTSAEFSVEPDFSNKSFSYWNNEPECNKEAGTTNSFIVTINGTIPRNSEITLRTTDDPKTFSYKTLCPFDRVRISDYTDYTDGNMENPLKIILTQIPDEQSVLQYVSVHDKAGNVYNLTKDNIVINGRWLTIHSLPLELNSEYYLYVANGFRDKYGQLYNNGNGTLYYTFKTRPVKAYVTYLDYGARMLEAQFPHKLLYEHQNVLSDSYYMIRSFTNPLYTSDKGIYLDHPVYINDEEKNRRHFEEIDLDPYLTNGYGFVRFDANTKYKDIDYWDGEEYTKEDTNILTVQVTDLGITTRMGINRAVVMVRSLSTNKPVTDADVYILNENSKLQDDPLNHILAQGKPTRTDLQ